MYNILLIGNGGREHALALKISESPLCSKLWISPGNPGTANLGQNIELSVNHSQEVIDFCHANSIQLVMIGPEAPLVQGLADDLRAAKIWVVGPGASGARLEGSKAFSKDFFKKFNIQTAKYQNFTKGDSKAVFSFVKELGFPVVLKCDGLAAGKGVVICASDAEVQNTLDLFWSANAFGEAANQVVVEQFLKGIEVSIFVFTDGLDYIILPEAKDYKRIGDADTGENTGGMGAVSPVHFVNDAFIQKFKEKILHPTLEGLKNEQIPFQGVLFAGIMNVEGEPYILEYNVRMGDPETQVVLPRIQSDFVELLVACASKNLAHYTLKISNQVSFGVVLASKGYPGTFEKGKKFSIETSDVQVLLAGVGSKSDELVTAGGRVCMLQTLGNSILEAREKIYQNISKVNFENKYYRQDIGLDLLDCL